VDRVPPKTTPRLIVAKVIAELIFTYKLDPQAPKGDKKIPVA
jgi:hypothetical protein